MSCGNWLKCSDSMKSECSTNISMKFKKMFMPSQWCCDIICQWNYMFDILSFLFIYVVFMYKMNFDVLMYFQTNYFWIMSEGKTSRSGRNLRETVRFGHDPATHTTFIAKTMKCKVKLYLNWTYLCKIFVNVLYRKRRLKYR